MVEICDCVCSFSGLMGSLGMHKFGIVLRFTKILVMFAASFQISARRNASSGCWNSTSWWCTRKWLDLGLKILISKVERKTFLRLWKASYPVLKPFVTMSWACTPEGLTKVHFVLKSVEWLQMLLLDCNNDGWTKRSGLLYLLFKEMISQWTGEVSDKGIGWACLE